MYIYTTVFYDCVLIKKISLYGHAQTGGPVEFFIVILANIIELDSI
jgi:hypothetical protein